MYVQLLTTIINHFNFDENFVFANMTPDLVDFNQAIFMYKYTNKLLPTSFENIFKKLGNFERSLNYQLGILKMCSFQYLPSSSLLKMWNNLPLDSKRSNSLSIFRNRLLNSLFINYMTMCYKPNCYSCKTNQICFDML